MTRLAVGVKPESAQTASASDGRADWLWWFGPAALSLLLAFLFLDPFAGDWDAIDYTVLAIKGQPSSMALGRMLFIFANSALWHIFHAFFNLKPQSAFLIFKYAVVVETPLVIVLCWFLGRELGLSKQASTLASLLLGLSPAFVVYSGQAMTEIPSLLILAVALIIHIRGLRTRSVLLTMLGAMVLGLGVNVREPVGFFAPWLVFAPFVYGWRVDRRAVFTIVASLMVFCLFAIGPFALWFLSDVNHYRDAWFGWRLSMAEESARHPITFRNLLPFAGLFLASSPLVVLSLPFAFAFRKRSGITPALLLAVVGVFATLLLLGNYSSTVNWRYFLTALPAFAVFVAAFWIDDLKSRLVTFRTASIVVLVFGIVCGGFFWSIFKRQIDKRSQTPNYLETLSRIPQGSIVIAGAQSVAVNYFSGIGVGNWDAIGTGSGWPGQNLVPLIESDLKSGKRVFLDTDPRVWPLCGWQRGEIPQLVTLQTAFKFRRVEGTLFEVKDSKDLTAIDSPNLEILLPENRHDELDKCISPR